MIEKTWTKCLHQGCDNETKAKNGICPSCYHTKRVLRRYLQTKEGMEYLTELLDNAFDLKIVPKEQEQ